MLYYNNSNNSNNIESSFFMKNKNNFYLICILLSMHPLIIQGVSDNNYQEYQKDEIQEFEHRFTIINNQTINYKNVQEIVEQLVTLSLDIAAYDPENNNLQLFDLKIAITEKLDSCNNILHQHNGSLSLIDSIHQNIQTIIAAALGLATMIAVGTYALGATTTKPVKQSQTKVTKAEDTIVQGGNGVLPNQTFSQDPITTAPVQQDMTIDQMLQKYFNSAHQAFFKRLANMPKTAEELEKFEQLKGQVHPIFESKTLTLCQDFLNFKKEHGSNVEKAFYTDMQPHQFITRLLTQRAIYFYNRTDDYMLLNKQSGRGGFESIGKDNHVGYNGLTLHDCISYDEMLVSSLLSVSTKTPFINNGSRPLSGRKGVLNSFESEGVVIAQVGSRCEKAGVMEYLYCVVDSNNPVYANDPEGGYASAPEDSILKIFETYFDALIPSYNYLNNNNLLLDNSRYLAISDGRYLNIDLYTKRMRVVAENFLLEADRRAEIEGKQAVCVLKGLGCGEWKANYHQVNYLNHVYRECIAELSGQGRLQNIKEIEFNSILPEGESYPNINNISIIYNHYRMGDVAAPCRKRPSCDDSLLVVQMAWDSNSWLGNEFWCGLIEATDDPVVAGSSWIGYLGNPAINPSAYQLNRFIQFDEDADPLRFAAQSPLGDKNVLNLLDENDLTSADYGMRISN